MTDSKGHKITYNSIDTTNYLYGKINPEYTEGDEIFVNFSHNHPSGFELKFGLHKSKFTRRNIGGTISASPTYNVPCLDFKHNGKYLAMDIGLSKHTMVNSDGNFSEVINKRPDKYWEPRIQQIQSRLDHCKRYSKKWYQLKRNLNRMKQKPSNQLKDFQHKKTKNAVDNTKANIVLIGDLSAKQMASSKKGDKESGKSTHRGIHNSGYISIFAQFLTYKAIKIGKKIIIEIDEPYNSQECCNCGYRQKMPLYERTYNCSYCGQSIDRDKSSAIVIMVRYLRHNAPWTGYQRFAGNLRQTRPVDWDNCSLKSSPG